MTDRDIERLRQLTRTGAKLLVLIDAAAPLHQRNAARWFECPNEDEPIFGSFHQHVQHPVNAIVQVNVSRTGLIAFDKCACARSDKAMTRFITNGVVSLGLNNDAAASTPNQLAPNQVTRAPQWIAPKEFRANQLACQGLRSHRHAQLFGL